MKSARTTELPGSYTAPQPGANAEMQRVLDELEKLGGKPIETLSAQEARSQPTPADAIRVLLRSSQASSSAATAASGEAVNGASSQRINVQSVDMEIPGALGGMKTRVYTPGISSKPLPVIVYFHGGGWVLANREVYDAGARALARESGAIVLSPDYRRAPEHKFPAAHDDALAAYEWALTNSSAIGGDVTRVALAGESSGGNLAMATAVAAHESRLQRPLHVLAIYPVAHNDLNTESYREHAKAKPLNRAMMQWFVQQVTQTNDDVRDPRLDVVNADLSGLPDVTIINAVIDPLRTDGQLLETALLSAGVNVERRLYSGVTHEFFGMDAVLKEARDAQQYAGERLRKSLFSNNLPKGIQ